MKRKAKADTGFRGVYKTKASNTFYFSSYVQPNPSKKGRHYEFGFKTPEEAYEAKKKYEKQAITKQEYFTTHEHFAHLLLKYLENKKNIVKLSTYHSTELLINKYLEKDYRKFTISQFATNENLDAFRTKLLKCKICIDHKNRILHILREIYEYGGLINLVNSSDVSRIIVKTAKFVKTTIEPKKHDPRDNYWTLTQWKQFLSVIDKKDRYYLFFVIYGQLGCRIGEIRGLQFKHVNRSCTEITIEQQAQNKFGNGKTMITTPKTPSSIRTISISNYGSELLKNYIKSIHNVNPEHFLFFNRDRTLGVQTIRRKFDYFTSLAKLPRITLHGIRHSNCTWLLSKRMTPQEIGQVSKRLGHSSTKLTLDIYMGLHNEASKVITESLDEIY